METPTNIRQQRPARNPTPRLSSRKKSLFATGTDKGDDLHGIAPLVACDLSRDSTSTSPKSKRCINALLRSTTRSISFFDPESEVDDKKHQPTTATRRSVRLTKKNNSPCNSPSAAAGTKNETNGKENIPMRHLQHTEGGAEELQKLFSASMRLNGDLNSHTMLNIDATSESEEDCGGGRTSSEGSSLKRLHSGAQAVTGGGLSPQRKVPKVESVSISTKAFYSTMTAAVVSKVSPNVPLATAINLRSAPGSGNGIGTTTSPRSRRLDRNNINKGVRHKIRRRPRPPGAAGTRFRPRAPAVDIDAILGNLRNEKLRNLIVAKREERVQIEKAHSSFRTGHNSITMARPLSSLCGSDGLNNNGSNNNFMVYSDGIDKQLATLPRSAEHVETDFSDIEYDSEDSTAEDWRMSRTARNEQDEEEQVIPLISHQPTALHLHGSMSPDKSSVNCLTTPTTRRKFFKSGRATSTRMEVKITDNIRASVCNGKISLVQEQKKLARKRTKTRNSVINEFSDEQATVDAILKSLDDTTFGDVLDVTAAVSENHISVPEGDKDQQQLTFNNVDNDGILKEIELQNHTDYAEFRKRLPFETSDPEIIEQQHLLLDFLISNNICTNENFDIFITDPDNHKEEAARIVNEVIVVVNEQTNFRQRLPFNTNDPAIIEQQHSFLSFLIEHNICSEKNFDIFIANYDQRSTEAEEIVVSVQARQNNEDPIEEFFDLLDANGASTSKTNAVEHNSVLIASNLSSNANLSLAYEQESFEDEAYQPKSTQTSEKLFPIFYGGQCQPLVQHSTRRPQRFWTGGLGMNQYQIDAGQKRFGAQQCKQCGLVYTAHEPEEEKLHRDYHASLHVLRFKGWIDEDIVSIFTEWGSDGRILRITESSHIKRRDRLMDILKIVDKELGFSSYIIPKIFVAYFAVRKQQIVGLCLVQPLEKANKYLCINGVDCCTEEEFEAKCGISRIWVSPLHRRMRIAFKLIQAVQLNTIFGEEIPLAKIAFSAPTESGKIFAQKVAQTENFLVYQ